MAEGTGVRLDTVDIADGDGWQVDSTHEVDVFTRSAFTIEVRYSANDTIETAVKRSGSGDLEKIGQGTADTVERVRSWLTGRNDHQDQDHPKQLRAPRLRWTVETWLHKPTQEIVNTSDPRVPRTVDASNKQRKIWYKIRNQANGNGVHYRNDMDMDTATAAEPTYTVTCHPENGPAELLIRGTFGEGYWACVRHYQANYKV